MRRDESSPPYIVCNNGRVRRLVGDVNVMGRGRMQFWEL